MFKYKNNWCDWFLIPFTSGNKYSIVHIFSMMLGQLMPILQVYLYAWLIDTTIASLKQEINFFCLLVPFILLALIIVLQNYLQIIDSLLKQCVENGIRDTYVPFLTKKCASIKYAYIEDSVTCDLIKRVKNKPDEIMIKGYQAGIELLIITLEVLLYLIILFQNIKWLSFVIIFIAAIIIYSSINGGKKQYEAMKVVASDVRKSEYFDELLINREAASERKLFKFEKNIHEKWKFSYSKARKHELDVVKKTFIHMKTTSSLMAIVAGIIALVLAFPLSRRTISIGMYISLIQLSTELIDLMSWTVSDDITAFSKYVGYINDFHLFVKLENDINALELPSPIVKKIDSISFKNVSFSYPGTTKNVLQNISFRLDNGKHYAIVGANGSGKSTIIKILLGLYSNYEGQILINNMPLQSFTAQEKKAMFSVLFQDFAQYQISIHDNIGIGDINQLGTLSQNECIKKTIKKVGLDSFVNTLTNGIFTEIGYLDNNGIWLSGGEWQRLAIARSILSKASILILDEPTAALDPIAESKIYEDFDSISKDRTSIIITHRLASAKLADKILVLNNGKIEAIGNHSELMQQCTLYKEMFESQQSWYIKDE